MTYVECLVHRATNDADPRHLMMITHANVSQRYAHGVYSSSKSSKRSRITTAAILPPTSHRYDAPARTSCVYRRCGSLALRAFIGKLARADPDWFGVTVFTVDGQVRSRALALSLSRSALAHSCCGRSCRSARSATSSTSSRFSRARSPSRTRVPRRFSVST